MRKREILDKILKERERREEEVEKILFKTKDINEAQLDFHYLTSPAEIEKKLSIIGSDNYQPIKYSNIFLNISGRAASTGKAVNSVIIIDYYQNMAVQMASKPAILTHQDLTLLLRLNAKVLD